MKTDSETGALIELSVEGMTCAACANRIEKKLNKLDGVVAVVNYATEKASIQAPAGITAADLVQTVIAAGYDAKASAAETTDRAAQLLPRLLLAAALGVPVIVISMVPELQFRNWQWVILALSAIVVYWCGRSFHKAAWTNLRHGTTTMDTLVSLGTNAAFIWSLVAMLFGDAGRAGDDGHAGMHMHHGSDWWELSADPLGQIYFEAAVGVVVFLLLGRYLEARSKRVAGQAMRTILAEGAKEALLLRDGATEQVSASSLKVGDVVVVLPGEKVPVDGEVIEGNSAVVAAIVTGEAMPVEVGPGSQVVGGAVNATGRLLVRASAVGAGTQLAQLARLVVRAQTGKAQAQAVADRIIGYFVPGVVALAILTLAGQLIAGQGLTYALNAAICVLIIACPCALGLATPSALLAGAGRGAEIGVVIRGPEVLEHAHGLKAVLLDKTGTLTTGAMKVLAVRPVAEFTKEALLQAAAAVEAGSAHPIARAIVAAAPPEGLAAQDFTSVPGKGAHALVQLPTGQAHVHVGSSRYAAELGVMAASTVAGVATEVFVLSQDKLLGSLVVGDELKPDAQQTVDWFRKAGLRPVLVTGDAAPAAAEVAAKLGIEEVRSEVLPSGKSDVVAEFQAHGARVVMIGDGVNDSAALATADLGIAIGAGSDAAAAAGDLTLMRDDLLGAADAIRLSRATRRTILTNLGWAFGYNLAAIPIAAMGLLNPMVAGAAMAASSVFVVLNSLLLRKFKRLNPKNS